MKTQPAETKDQIKVLVMKIINPRMMNSQMKTQPAETKDQCKVLVMTRPAEPKDQCKVLVMKIMNHQMKTKLAVKKGRRKALVMKKINPRIMNSQIIIHQSRMMTVHQISLKTAKTKIQSNPTELQTVWKMVVCQRMTLLQTLVHA